MAVRTDRHAFVDEAMSGTVCGREPCAAAGGAGNLGMARGASCLLNTCRRIGRSPIPAWPLRSYPCESASDCALPARLRPPALATKSKRQTPMESVKEQSGSGRRASDR